MRSEAASPNARAYLGRYLAEQNHLAQLRDRLEKLRQISRDTSHRLDPVGGSHTAPRGKLEALMAEIDSTEREIRPAEIRLNETRIELGMAICRTSGSQMRQMLTLCYLEGKSWKEISWALGCSVATVRRVLAAGLAEMEEILASEDF